MKPTISIIVPVFNEEQVLRELYDRTCIVMEQEDEPWELIMVDDGSVDGSADLIAQLNADDERVKGLSFSRNFGFQLAATAGLAHAQGEAVILSDADLQDPPEVIPQMIAKWREGYDVVYGVRISRQGDSWFKQTTAKAFYRIIRRITNIEIPLDTGDFRLMDRRVVNASDHRTLPFLSDCLLIPRLAHPGLRYTAQHEGCTVKRNKNNHSWANVFLE